MTDSTPPEAEALFQRLVARFSDDPSVTPPSAGKGFGASGLKVDGKIFAMLSRGELVVKLPRQRVDELVDSGTGRPFDPGHGRVMKEWVRIAPRHSRSWAKLAEEALQFVAAAARPSRRR
jgi:TfoX/Sxy family transcriptional regulator of competence genes